MKLQYDRIIERKGAIQLLRNARGGWGGVKIFQKSVTLQLILPLTKCYRGWGGVKIYPKMRYVTVEWPQKLPTLDECFMC